MTYKSSLISVEIQGKVHQLFYLLMITTFLISCHRKNSGAPPVRAYDIIVVIGQSNAYYGLGQNSGQDKTSKYIKQLGRFGENNLQIIPAKDPLEHFTIASNRNSFAMTFAREYSNRYLEEKRVLLLIPAALEGSSFSKSQWSKGDVLYNDVVTRIKYILDKYPESEVKAFLWHQGESDVMRGRQYGDLLDKMIIDLRTDVAGSSKGSTIPFIIGGMVPYWVDLEENRKTTDSVIAETPLRLSCIGYASAREPYVLEKSNNTFDDIHFSAAGQRELGYRYFLEFQKIMN